MKRNLHCYAIQLEGRVGADWVDWPCRVDVYQVLDGEGVQPVTTLTVSLPDQPALHGLLQVIRDLNLPLVSVQRVDWPPITTQPPATA